MMLIHIDKTAETCLTFHRLIWYSEQGCIYGKESDKSVIALL
jgi:hypothetical protein